MLSTMLTQAARTAADNDDDAFKSAATTITGLITVKTGKSILKKCRNYIHFANTTKADFKVFLKV